MSAFVSVLVAQYAERCATHHGRKVNVNFYGGEPFLNFGAVQFIAIHAPAQFTIFTNGATATTEQVKWCQEHGIVPKRSTAGCPEAAALTRPGGYTDQWLAEGELWGDKGETHRLTVTPATAPYVTRSIAWLPQQGYRGQVDLATDDYAQWPTEAQAVYASELHQLTQLSIEHFRRGEPVGIANFTAFGRAIYGQSGAMVMGCGAGWETIGITWDGYVCLCHRFLRAVRAKPLHLKDVLAGEPLWFGSGFRDRLADVTAGNEDSACKVCVARQCCPHGCLHVSYKLAGRYSYQPAHRCNFIRLYQNCAAEIHKALSPLDPKWWEREATKP
jgi:radical SAM protein with 4Fe4S-binding SPASM domain